MVSTWQPWKYEDIAEDTPIQHKYLCRCYNSPNHMLIILSFGNHTWKSKTYLGYFLFKPLPIPMQSMTLGNVHPSIFKWDEDFHHQCPLRNCATEFQTLITTPLVNKVFSFALIFLRILRLLFLIHFSAKGDNLLLFTLYGPLLILLPMFKSLSCFFPKESNNC